MSTLENQVNTLKETVLLMQQFVNNDEIQKLKNTDYNKYKQNMTNIFKNFSEQYTSLFNMIIEGKDLKYLDLMLNSIIDISKGVDEQTNVEKRLGEDLADEYLYPNLPEHIRKKVKR
jgi:hypothetical protein